MRATSGHSNMVTQYTLTREQVRELDRLAIESFGVRGLILMENAGGACAREAVDLLGDAAGKTVAIFCGKGNNGGDGFVIARHLSNRGADVRVVLTGATEELLGREGDAATNLNIVVKMQLPLTEVLDADGIGNAVSDSKDADLLVDALLGTGVTGALRGIFRPLIEAVNTLKKPVLAVDLPSGLDSDTGAVLGSALRCKRTVTFAGVKRGFLNPEAAEYTGKVKVADIGIPRSLIEEKVAGWRRES